MPIPGQSSEETTAARPKKKASRHAKAASSVTSTHLNQNSQLLEAITQGKPRLVRRLLDSRSDPNYQGGPNMISPLMLACEVREEEAREAIVDLLLSKGADVNLQDAAGKTALMKAVLLDIPLLFSKILQKGADVRLVDVDGNTALSYAAEMGDAECVKLLVREGKRKSIHPDHQNLHGLTPLLLAAREGHLEVAKILVDAGASLSKRDLDNFMTAQEWMKLSSCYSEQELRFLSPSRKKKNFYRQERMKKGIKTLADYLPRLDESSGLDSPNVFTISDSRPVQFPTLQGNPFPTTTPEEDHSPVKSMFDVPAKKQISPLQHPGLGGDSMKRRSSISFPSVSSVKTDLYKSSYLSRRKSLLLKNSLSDGYHTGALAPLTDSTHPPQTHSKDMSSTKTNRLPPINNK